jgi:hypothetical protein
MRDSEHRQYTAEWLQHDRPQPMYDSSINTFYAEFYKDTPVHNNNLNDEFKKVFVHYLQSSTMNLLTGYDQFTFRDICVGCTQFIDDIYQRVGSANVMIFEHDYKYHWRLNNDIEYVTLATLDPQKELLISMPFPAYGDVHVDMQEILDQCYALSIPVHIDAAWVSCSRDITFNFDHPAVKTFAISLSKGGLGNNRVALRFARHRPLGAISVMNDFNMTCQSLVHMGIKYMQHFGPDYFWKKYDVAYHRVCADFNLVPTKAVHVARTCSGQIVGVRPLLRCHT